MSVKLMPSFFSFGLSIYYASHGEILIAVGWILTGALYGSIFIEGFWKQVSKTGLLTINWMKRIFAKGTVHASTFVRSLKQYKAGLIRHLQPHLKKAGDWLKGRALATGKSLQRRSVTIGGELLQNLKEKPWLWLGITFDLITLSLFVGAYLKRDSQLFHLGLATMMASACMFVTHFYGGKKVAEFFNDHRSETWVVVSTISLAVSLLHAILIQNTVWWYATGVSLFSLIVAVVVVNSWQGAIVEATEKAVGTAFEKVFGLLLTGEQGLTSLLLSWAVICFIPCLVLLLGNTLSDNAMNALRALGGLTIILLFAGIGAQVTGFSGWVNKTIGLRKL